MKSLDLSRYTGKGVRVAVVDTGIDVMHPDIGNLQGGVEISIGSDGEPIYSDAYSRDVVGHGTACAAIIRKKAPAVELLSIKILNQDLSADVRALVAAIRWAMEHGIHLVNLSLGTVEKWYLSVLQETCNDACRRGMILVAGGHGSGWESYPAVFPSVIGVTSKSKGGAWSYVYRPGQPIEFAARGDSQRLAWKDSRYVFLSGVSFAVAQISGIVARILEGYPGAEVERVREVLIANASKDTSGETPSSTDGYVLISQESLTQGETTQPSQQRQKYAWMKNVMLYPYNKEMHAFIRFADLLNFQVTGVVDPAGKGLVGKDAGEAIGLPPVGIVITSNLQKAMGEADTVILGHLEQLSRISQRDLLFETVARVVKEGKNLFSLTPLVSEKYTRLFHDAAEKGLQVTYPLIPLEEAIEKLQNAGQMMKKIAVPIVGVFGTSPDQGKFTTQLTLRRKLLQLGYRVSQIATEPHAGLFGCDLVFPYGYASAVGFPLDLYVPYLEVQMCEIAERCQPHIIIVGTQSGTIPYDFSLPMSNHTLPSIAFLFGTKPDAYILTVNSKDPCEYIQDTIHALHALGKGQTILLTMSHQEKDVRTLYGRYRTVTRRLADGEVVQKLSMLEEWFHLPATEVTSEQGQEKLLRTVIDYFAVEER
jgi:uncharacterized NAD-dependent epimerase/dehydratase family protein